MAITQQQAAALRQVVGAVVDTVREVEPHGAPGGVLYAGMMAQGCTLQQFQGIMAGCVRAGWLTKDGEVYHLGPEADKVAPPASKAA